jgi:hypothetical protein
MELALELDRDPMTRLEQQWKQATVAAARAQRAYQDLQRSAPADERVEARAWLRLWKAERRKADVLIALDALER